MNMYFSYLFIIIICLFAIIIYYIYLKNLNQILYFLLYVLNYCIIYIYYFIIACMFCTHL